MGKIKKYIYKTDQNNPAVKAYVEAVKKGYASSEEGEKCYCGHKKESLRWQSCGDIELGICPECQSQPTPKEGEKEYSKFNKAVSQEARAFKKKQYHPEEGEKCPEPKFIKEYGTSVYRVDPDNPNGIITDNGEKIDIDPQSQPTPDKWEEEWEKLILNAPAHMGYGFGWGYYWTNPLLLKEKIRSLLSKQLSQTRKEERKRIKREFTEWARKRIESGQLTKKKSIQNQELTFAVGFLSTLSEERKGK